MSLLPHQLELLSPARDADIGIEAINHGADAVYIGGPAFGARASAGNDIRDIERLVKHAHRFNSRIFITLNTILRDDELEAARQMAWQVYEAGADALIIQDMGLLEIDLPPIQLHASTQTDIRTPEKARFLQDAGLSQIVLARELTVQQIAAVHKALGPVDAPGRANIEFFIHGALCVAYSGQCNISHAQTGRSANRGDCSQACRLPYQVTDAQGRIIAHDKHVLSMKDNNQSDNLRTLIDVGVRSFKIEGRYKDMGYVKNITAHYRLLLDEILARRPELARASSGECHISFTPNPDKTFHRGSTDYFATGRKGDIGAFDSPKFVGLPLGVVSRVHAHSFELVCQDPLSNGDGLNFMKKRDVIGVQANTVQHLGADADGERWKITPNDPAVLAQLKPGMQMHRNRDHAWEQALSKKSADRRVGVWLTLSDDADGLALTLTDEDGLSVTRHAPLALEPARDGERALASLREQLAKLGNSMFVARDITLRLRQPWFAPASLLNALRRDAVAELQALRVAQWPRPPRKTPVEPPAAYPETSLSYLANVYNHLARQFYTRHGVSLIDAAYEAHEEAGEVSLMITKHCLRFSFNLCPKQAKGVKGVMGQVRADPMVLKNGNETYTLKFECRPCEMHVMGKMKKHIFQSPPPVSLPAVAPVTFHPRRPD